MKNADLDLVVASISSPTAMHFTTDMEMEQDTKKPVIDLTNLSHWSPNVQKTIMELQQNAGSARHYLQRMHITLAQLKSQVSDTDFDKIYKSVKLPQTKEFNCRFCGTK